MVTVEKKASAECPDLKSNPDAFLAFEMQTAQP